MSSVILDSIEPYNDLFYRECFYNSMFPIIYYYNQSIMPMIADSIPIYCTELYKEYQMLGCHYEDLVKEDEVLRNMGVIHEAKEKSNDVISDLKCCINEQCPVILWIDCYYETLRADTYQVLHRPHTLLVHGYDDEKELCYIIEHTKRDSLTYQKMTISYDNLRLCYEKYVEDMMKECGNPSFHQFIWRETESAMDEDDLSEVYDRCRERYQSELESGLHHLNEFKQCVQQICSSQQRLDEYVEALIASLNNIINAKTAEKFLLENIDYEDDERFSKLAEQLDCYQLVRLTLFRYTLKHRYQEGAMKELSMRMEQIVKLEEKLLS